MCIRDRNHIRPLAVNVRFYLFYIGRKATLQMLYPVAELYCSLTLFAVSPGILSSSRSKNISAASGEMHSKHSEPSRMRSARYLRSSFESLFSRSCKSSSSAAKCIETGGRICLLYTSDAADDLLCVDLGGRRIIKKKKKKKTH